jgi:hypothetical protein
MLGHRMRAELTPRLEGSRFSLDVEVPVSAPALRTAVLGAFSTSRAPCRRFIGN